MSALFSGGAAPSGPADWLAGVEWDARLTAAEAPLLNPEELSRRIIWQSEDALVVDKPGWIVCHPSKAGPWSSLAGAVREWLGADRMHLVSRLDRETSGVVVFALNKATARALQMAVEARRVRKVYEAVVVGEMFEPVELSGALSGDPESAVHVKMRVSSSRSRAVVTTRFEPRQVGQGLTHCEVTTLGGKKHQIRLHAQSAGFPLLGEKLYGADEKLYLEFVEKGWTENLRRQLRFPRQALHCAEVCFSIDGWQHHLWRAPRPPEFEVVMAGLRG